MSRYVRTWIIAAAILAGAGMAGAQDQHAQMNMPAQNSWMFMQDGILFAEFDHQGGPRGGDQFVAPNWWMGMASRQTSRGRVTFNGMLSLDPATVGTDGYREIFQAGEALNGKPLIDRQHPHDLFMQLAAVWRLPIDTLHGVHPRRRSRRRARPGSGGVHAPSVGRRQPDGAAQPSHVRFDSHRL